MKGLEATVSLNQRYRRISGFPSPFLIYWPNNIGHIHILLLTFAEWQLLKPLATGQLPSPPPIQHIYRMQKPSLGLITFFP